MLGKRTAEDIILKKMEDIVEKKLGDYRHPKKKQKTVNGGVPSSKKLVGVSCS
ncbi:MAG: hypothetical protein Q8874_02555 [Sweet potato little leaf phytoplasma]|nr:hypothetical protein [Sweet potato little leaf phytoplasma]